MTINLTFIISRADRKPATVDDARQLGEFLEADGDALSLEGGRFILDDVRDDGCPRVVGGKLSVSFEVDVSAYDGDEIDAAGLAFEVYEAAIILLPDDYEVARLTVLPA